MASYLVSLIVIIVLGLNAALGGYHLYRIIRPRKMTWNARIYQLGKGKHKHKTPNGKPVSNLMLQDLIPYATDIIERISAPNRQVIFRLQKLNITVPEVTANVIEKWGKSAYVDVLIKENQATLLKKSFDANGNALFNPIPRDRIETLSADQVARVDRYVKNKNVWSEVFKYVTIVMALVMIGFIAHSNAKMNTEMGDKLLEMQEEGAKHQKQIAKQYGDSLKQFAFMIEKKANLAKENQNINKGNKLKTNIDVPSIE